jgi:hypothetical protein
MLKVLCKSYKRKRKIENRNESEQKKGGTSPTGPHPGPKARQQPSTGRASPDRAPLFPLCFLFYFFSSTDGWDRLVIPVINPQPLLPEITAPVSTISSTSRTTQRPRATLLSSPYSSSPLSLFSPLRNAVNQTESLAGGCSNRRRN